MRGLTYAGAFLPIVAGGFQSCRWLGRLKAVGWVPMCARDCVLSHRSCGELGCWRAGVWLLWLRWYRIAVVGPFGTHPSLELAGEDCGVLHKQGVGQRLCEEADFCWGAGDVWGPCEYFPAEAWGGAEEHLSTFFLGAAGPHLAGLV